MSAELRQRNPTAELHPGRHWSLHSLQAKLINTGAKVVAHSRGIIFQTAEVSVPRALFEAILKRIGELAPVAA